MTSKTDIAKAPTKENALEVFRASNGLDPYLAHIRAEIDGFIPDVTTRKGREAIASIAHSVARSKTTLDNIGKELVAELKEVPKLIDAERKRMRDLLDAWKDEVRKPLDDWQAAEDARINAHNDRLEWLRGLPLNLTGVTSAHVQGLIEQAETVAIDDTWEEFKAEAAGAKDLATKALRAILAELQRYESEQAELVRLRAEAEAQAQRDRDAEIARAAAEQARLQAEQQAQAERDAAARREQELRDQAAATQRAAEQAARDAEVAAENQRLQLQLQAEQAERAAEQAKADKLAAEQRAEQERIAADQRAAKAAEDARLAEVARQKAAADEIIRQQQERQADVAHKSKILGEAKQALIGMNISEELAKAIVLKIARGEVPNVTISF